MKPTSAFKILAVVPVDPNNLQGSMVFSQREIERLKERGQRVQTYLYTERGLGLSFIRNLRALYKEVRSFKPDIIHAHYGTITSFLCTFMLPWAPLVITFRGCDLNWNRNNSFLRRLIGQLMSQYSAFLARTVICVGPSLLDKVWAKKGKVITDGVDCKRFTPIPMSEARKYLNIPMDEEVVLFNASNDPKTKRRDLFEKSFLEIKKQFPRARAIIFENKTPHNDIPYYFNAADCMVLCSDSEGSPVMIKESLACNLPIVSVDVGDVKMMIAGVSESYICEQSPESITEHVCKLLKRRLRSNGTDFKERYSSDVKIQELISTYHATSNPQQ